LEGLRTISTLLTIWPSSSSTSLWRRDAVRVPVTWAVAVRPKAAPARAANAKRYSPGWVKWLPGPLTLAVQEPAGVTGSRGAMTSSRSPWLAKERKVPLEGLVLQVLRTRISSASMVGWLAMPRP
jgi:hypothetical protein